MGNYRFKMSDMLPNAWFYKLNHTSTGKLQNLTHKSSNKKVQSKTKSSPFSSSTAATHKQTCHLRNSYYFNRDFKSTSHLPESRRKSSDRRHDREKNKASVYSTPHMLEHVQNDSVFHDLNAEFTRLKVDSPLNHYVNRIENDNSVRNHNHQKAQKWRNFDLVPQLGLKPIITKLDKGDEGKTGIKFQEKSTEFEEGSSCGIGEKKNCPVRKRRVNSVEGKLRANSPRLSLERLTQVGGKSASSHSRLRSVAVVKDTKDPDRDFKESMMEMITEHNISTKEEFEQLLACYLSLNSEALHGLIINVFEQIWFEITRNQVLVSK